MISNKPSTSEPGIYKLVNVVNGKVWIGQTTNLKQRFYSHQDRFNRNCNSEYLQSDYNLNHDFSFEILQIMSNSNEKERVGVEVNYILKHKSNDLNYGYNINIGKAMFNKKNPMYNKTVYDVWVDKFGEERAIELEEKRRRKLSQSLAGTNNPMYGKKQSEESNRKNSESQKVLSTEKELEVIKMINERKKLGVIANYFNVTYGTVRSIKRRYEHLVSKDVLKRRENKKHD